MQNTPLLTQQGTDSLERQSPQIDPTFNKINSAHAPRAISLLNILILSLFCDYVSRAVSPFQCFFLGGGCKILYGVQIASMRFTCFAHYFTLNLTMVKICCAGFKSHKSLLWLSSDAVLLAMFSTGPCS